MRLPVGISDFEKLIEGDYLFADKSLLIKDIMEDGADVILITRPRRFGKTLNLSMLSYFLSKSHADGKNLFEDLNISKDEKFCKKHQQQYPVIFITFKGVKESNYTDAYNKIVVLMSELYRAHRYLLEGNLLHPEENTQFMAVLDQKADLANISVALKQLAIYMTRKFNQSPIILIDEYDTPIQEAYLKEYYEEMIGLMRGILGDALKDNRPGERILSKAILTGITRIAQESLFSGVNNLFVYTLLQEKYGQYFGFSEEEVLQLREKSHQTISLESIKEWYNGYQVGKYLLYNPWSIINCLYSNGELKLYWVNTASSELIKKLLTQANLRVKKELGKLLQGQIIEQPISENLIFPELEKQAPAVWSLLLYTGYLKVLSSKLQGSWLMAKMAIPNKEVSFVYDNIINLWFDAGNNLELYDSFAQSLAEGNMKTFKDKVSTYLLQTGSYFDFNSNTPEQVFHVFFLGLVAKLSDRYIIASNQEAGLGRLDIIFIPKKSGINGIIVEFKKSPTADLLLEKAQEALEQIKDRQYVERFKQYDVPSVLAIGMAFFEKKMELTYEDISIIG